MRSDKTWWGRREQVQSGQRRKHGDAIVFGGDASVALGGGVNRREMSTGG